MRSETQSNAEGLLSHDKSCFAAMTPPPDAQLGLYLSQRTHAVHRLCAADSETGTVVLRRGSVDQCDIRVTQFEQMPHGLACEPCVVVSDGWQRGVGLMDRRCNQGRSEPLGQTDELGFVFQPGNDQRSRAHFEQRSGALKLHAGICPGRCDDQAVAIGVQTGLQRLQERGEDRVIDGGDNGANGVGPARVERACKRVRRKFQPGGDTQHALARRLRDQSRIVQGPRCRGGRNASLARNIAKGNSARRLLSTQCPAFGHGGVRCVLYRGREPPCRQGRSGARCTAACATSPAAPDPVTALGVAPSQVQPCMPSEHNPIC